MATYTIKSTESCTVSEWEYDESSEEETINYVDGTRIDVKFTYDSGRVESVTYRLPTEDATEITSHINDAASKRVELDAALDSEEETTEEVTSSVDGITLNEEVTV